MDLVLNEPVAIPWPDGAENHVGVYWLRIYRRGGSAVVIITAVPGNPGPSPTNAASLIGHHIAQTYLAGVPRVRWFECYPGGSPGSNGKTEYSKVAFSGPAMTPVWAKNRRKQKASRWRISVAIRRRLQLLPPHEEVLRRVLAAGGELEAPLPTELYVIVPASEVPPPHSPFKCPHEARFSSFSTRPGYLVMSA